MITAASNAGKDKRRREPDAKIKAPAKAPLLLASAKFVVGHLINFRELGLLVFIGVVGARRLLGELLLTA